MEVFKNSSLTPSITLTPDLAKDIGEFLYVITACDFTKLMQQRVALLTGNPVSCKSTTFRLFSNTKPENIHNYISVHMRAISSVVLNQNPSREIKCLRASDCIHDFYASIFRKFLGVTIGRKSNVLTTLPFFYPSVSITKVWEKFKSVPPKPDGMSKSEYEDVVNSVRVNNLREYRTLFIRRLHIADMHCQNQHLAHNSKMVDISINSFIRTWYEDHPEITNKNWVFDADKNIINSVQHDMNQGVIGSCIRQILENLIPSVTMIRIRPMKLDYFNEKDQSRFLELFAKTRGKTLSDYKTGEFQPSEKTTLFLMNSPYLKAFDWIFKARHEKADFTTYEGVEVPQPEQLQKFFDVRPIVEYGGADRVTETYETLKEPENIDSIIRNNLKYLYSLIPSIPSMSDDLKDATTLLIHEVERRGLINDDNFDYVLFQKTIFMYAPIGDI